MIPIPNIRFPPVCGSNGQITGLLTNSKHIPRFVIQSAFVNSQGTFWIRTLNCHTDLLPVRFIENSYEVTSKEFILLRPRTVDQLRGDTNYVLAELIVALGRQFDLCEICRPSAKHAYLHTHSGRTQNAKSD
jgi:hypothetical protein